MYVCIGLKHDVFPTELSKADFIECKEKMRPVKKALKQLDRPPNLDTEQAKTEHTKNCLLQIGDRIIECLKEIQESQRSKYRGLEQKFLLLVYVMIYIFRNLWMFVSKFTEFSPDKLVKFYLSACKKREKNKSTVNVRYYKPSSFACYNLFSSKIFRNKKIQNQKSMCLKSPTNITAISQLVVKKELIRQITIILLLELGMPHQIIPNDSLVERNSDNPIDQIKMRGFMILITMKGDHY